VSTAARRECSVCGRDLALHQGYLRDPTGPEGWSASCRRCNGSAGGVKPGPRRRGPVPRAPEREHTEPEPQEPKGPLPVDVAAGWERIIRVAVVEERLVIQSGRPCKMAGGGVALLADGRGLSVPAAFAGAIAQAIQRVAREG
jgi:hypothetical protein